MPSAGTTELDSDCWVMPEAWDAVNLFLLCQNSWLLAPDGSRMALLRSELRATAEVFGMENLADLFSDVLVMESAIIEEDNRMRKLRLAKNAEH